MTGELTIITNELDPSTLQIIYAGRLDIGRDGEHQIKSGLDTDEAAQAYGETVRPHIVWAEDMTTGVCIDGRGCRCLSCDVMPITESSITTLSMPDYKKSPIRPKLEGGLVNSMTDAALLANWSGFTEEDLVDYNTARTKVEDFLLTHGLFDSAHTSDVSYSSADTTECGAWGKKVPAMQYGALTSTQSLLSANPSALDVAVGSYSDIVADILVQPGMHSGEPSTEAARQNYQAIRRTQQQLVARGLFSTFDAVAKRDSMKVKSPTRLEVLYSDAKHPTHNHKEPALFIIDTVDPRPTVDRDAMYLQDGFSPFVDNRNFRRYVSNIMAKDSEEEARLIMAGDVATVDVSDQLIARGMPVFVVK